jgi:hypothetical protein
MKKAIVVVILGGLMFVGAAKLVAQKNAPSEPEQEKELTLKLKVSEVNYVLLRLQDGKYSEAGPVINKIVEQARPQLDSTTQKK